MMSTTAPTLATTPIPVQLSAPEFEAFLFPHLSMPTRGPKGKLGSYCVFNLMLRVRYTGMQGKCLPVPTDAHGTPAMHSPPVSTGVATWADDGSLWQACGARVRPRAVEQPRALRVLQGDGTNPVATQGARASAPRAPSTSKARRSSP